jgi:hypothetical protein
MGVGEDVDVGEEEDADKDVVDKEGTGGHGGAVVTGDRSGWFWR